MVMPANRPDRLLGVGQKCALIETLFLGDVRQVEKQIGGTTRTHQFQVDKRSQQMRMAIEWFFDVQG